MFRLPPCALFVTALGLLLAAGAAVAQTKAAAPAEGPAPHRGPPPEALAACKTLAAGAACTFTGPKGAQTGNCFAPEGKPLACRPKHGPEEHGGQGGQKPPKPAN